MTDDISSNSTFKFWALLISLLAVFILGPFFERPNQVNFIANILLVFSLISSIWIISHDPRKFTLAVLLALPLVLSSLLPIELLSLFIMQLSIQLSGIIFFIYVTVFLLNIIIQAKQVTTDIVIGAICVYMLMGLGWAFVYGLLDLVNASSFSNTINHHGSISQFFYFSLVTLTTVGYGDIIPMTPVARSFATLQAMVGQIYLTVLVAKLVGMHSVKNANQ